VVWSPRKTREARACKSVKERRERELQLQKAKGGKLKEAAQLQKLKIVVEGRAAREAAKVVREKEKAEQAAERARKKNAQNVGKALQLSQKGKRKASRSPLRRSKRQKHVVDAAQGVEVVEAPTATPIVTTRCGRNITLPSKYR
jgi:hypothetical protein